MNKIETLIQTLQKELVSRKKSYFGLAQANKILKEKGLLSDSEISGGYLKEILEKGLIPQATRTHRKPRQWRICLEKPKSSNIQTDSKTDDTLGTVEIKSIQQGEKKVNSLINTERTHRPGEDQLYFICPMCGVNVSVPKRYRKHDELKCFHCHGTFKNPIFHPKDSTLYKKYNAYTPSSNTRKNERYEVSGSNTRREKNGCFFGLLGFSILFTIGGLLCLTGIGCVLGIPLVLAAFLFPIINTQALALKGPCPYCGYEATGSILHNSFNCQTCKQRIIIKNGNFHKLII